MKMFWTIFFVGSMLLVGLDVRERRLSAELSPGPATAGDAMGAPTPSQ